MIDEQTVQYIAGLSRLRVQDQDSGRFARDLEVILHYVRQLEELDVKDVPATSHALNIQNVFRKDEIGLSLTQEQALSFAIEKNSGHYIVPKVIE